MKKSLNPIAALLLAYAVGALLYSVWLVVFVLRLPTDGCGGIYLADGFSVDQLPPWPTSVQKGDLIQRIGEHDVREGLVTPGRWYDELFGTQVTHMPYTLVRDGKEVTVDVPWGKPTLGWLLLRNISLVILTVVFVLSGAFIAWQRGDDPAVRLLAVFLISEGMNLANNMIPAIGTNTGLALFWFGFPTDILSMCITVSAAFHVLLLFPEVKWLGRRFPRLLYVVHLLNPVLSIVGGLLWQGGAWFGNQVAGLALRDKTFILGYGIVGIELIVGIAHLVHTYLTTQKTGVRNQIRWLIWGVVVGIVPWFLFSSVPYSLTGKPIVPFYAVTPFFGLIPLALTFSIARYGLMSIDTLINRSLVYAVLTGVLVTINFVIVELFSNVLKAISGVGYETIVIVLSTLTSVIVFSAVRGYLQRLIDRIFYRGRLNFEQILREMGERLTTTLIFDNLATLLTEYIPARLQLTRAILFADGMADQAFVARPQVSVSLERDGLVANWLRQEKRPLIVSQVRHPTPELMHELGLLGNAEIEVCLPLRRADKLIGVYALGRKKSGDLYDDKEVNTLILLSHQISSAMENTRLFREVEEYSRTLESQVEARTQELRETNAKLADTAWDLAEQSARLDTILQNIADGLVVTDLEGRIVLTNAVFERIVGIGGSALQEMSLPDAFPDNALMEIVQRAMTMPKRPTSGEVAFDGHIYKASASALSQASAITGAATVLRDITHEVEVDRMKTDFISTVSHELRTPLTSILGFAKLILRNFERDIAPKVAPGDSRGQRSAGRIVKNLGIIESESQRLTRLITNLLDIAKMEAGKVEWHMEDVHIDQVIQSAVAGVSSLVEEKQLPLRVELEPDLPVVTADHDRLIQVVTNLLSNAIKFTDEGEIVIHAWHLGIGQDILPHGERTPETVAGLPAELPMLAVSVTDTGMGIRSEQLPEVFERFKQVGDVLTGRPAGTGLGLPICQEIVEYHGGRIWVESTPGVGSRFVFTLPLEKAPETTTVIRREIRRRISASLPEGPETGQTILVVDDEPSIRALLYQELTDAGYRVIQAADGMEAVEIARTQRPDLVLLDVMMPGLSGFDVTSVLKSDGRTRHIPILILSIIEDREKGFRLGADEYLTKPVDADKLLDTIASLLRESAGERRVLIVDQDVTAVEAITRVLRERGFTVVAAYDPRGAIRQAEETRPDLVILDAVISQANDYDLLKALKYQAETRDMNIIVLVGGVSEADPDELLRRAAGTVEEKEEHTSQ